MDSLVKEGFDISKIKYIIGRGGFTYPLKSGVYLINDRMLEHLRAGICGQHASNLGPLIADYFALQIPGAHAYIADPVVTDELENIARFSGHPEFERRSVFHTLNQKATARQHAKETGIASEELDCCASWRRNFGRSTPERESY
jgi:butyrate kinase